MAFYIWGNAATYKGVAGILLVIFGSGLYTWVQMVSAMPISSDKKELKLLKKSAAVDEERPREK